MTNFSPLMDTMDKMNGDMNIGENGHYQYKWNHNIQEKILQFYYQLIRTKEKNDLEMTYKELILEVFTSSKLLRDEKLNYLDVLYKLIGNTRDIHEGKGEYELTYMMILVWATIYYDYIELQPYKEVLNELANRAIQQLVHEQVESSSYASTSNKTSLPIGSFKDIKYFLNYWRHTRPDIMHSHSACSPDLNENHPVFDYCISLLNQTLALDEYKYNQNIEGLSLVSKWIPREKSKKFGWITKYLALDYYRNDDWLKSTLCKSKSNSTSRSSKILAEKKALTMYRKLVSTLNRQIDTVQIKQCSKQWKYIDFDKGVTSITMFKQKYAFANKLKKGSIRSYETDRMECSIHFNHYIDECKNGNKKMKGKLVSIYDFVKDALIVNQETNPEIYEMINMQWNDMFNHLGVGMTNKIMEDNSSSNSNSKLICDKNGDPETTNIKQKNENFIVMVDTSFSMSNDDCIPLYNALGLGILFAEKSKLGKRILTFSHSPSWVNLDNCNDFISKVKELKEAEWGGNTNFYAAFKKILEAYKFMNIDPDTVEDYKLLILSDMQIDFNDSEISKNAIFNVISKKFKDAGMKSEYKKPYKVPTIVFWNLRKTNGFPATSVDDDVIMISGYNPMLVNHFIKDGTAALNECTPWKMMLHVLENQRYNEFSNSIVELFYNAF
jgi:hypothetical protein